MTRSLGRPGRRFTVFDKPGLHCLRLWNENTNLDESLVASDHGWLVFFIKESHLGGSHKFRGEEDEPSATYDKSFLSEGVEGLTIVAVFYDRVSRVLLPFSAEAWARESRIVSRKQGLGGLRNWQCKVQRGGTR